MFKQGYQMGWFSVNCRGKVYDLAVGICSIEILVDLFLVILGLVLLYITVNLSIVVLGALLVLLSLSTGILLLNFLSQLSRSSLAVPKIGIVNFVLVL